MDDLQWGLLLSGIFVLIVVLAYNARRRMRMIQHLSKSSILFETRGEEARAELEDGGAKNEGFDSLISLKHEIFSIIDDRIDCVVLLEFPSQKCGQILLDATRKFIFVGTKPIFIEGHVASHGISNVICERSANPLNGRRADFLPLRLNKDYDSILIAVQIADRSGPLTELEFSEFAINIERLAQKFDVLADIPDMVEVVSRARELDAFALKCDIQLALNILSDSDPWSADLIHKVFVEEKLELLNDGVHFFKLSDSRARLFSLTLKGINFLQDDLLNGYSNLITLSLDVPMIDKDIAPFHLLRNYAAVLANRLGGSVVDDQHRPLTILEFDSIESRLLSIYGCLEKAGMPAGSKVACRLFSKKTND